MAELKFKPESRLDTLKKQKVYFTCHPEDFELCFRSVSETILNSADCVICYYELGDEPENDENYQADLKNMRLFVIPVTREFLEEDCRAMREFRFAEENHIPVLMLMQKSGLERLFEAKCGNLQFLENNQDKTGIPYEEKLKRYLDSTLLGSRLAEEIRNAFDAHIFLSYRKKDRKYADELMRLIHKDDLFQNIAIWYDEFLVPGERFDDAIRSALEQSDLFLLAVTPNIVEKDNYVIRKEYPLAREKEKPILPVELVSTDKNDLKNEFADIPDCTDAHDPSALFDALADKLNCFADDGNDSDPRHNYLIGCAYLGGIDVEKDHKKALKLITGAAEAGCTDAMIKLSDMYWNGDGVGRDCEKAVQWLVRVVRQTRDEYARSGDVRKGVDGLRRMQELAAQWSNKTSNMNILTDLYLAVYEFADRLLQGTADREARNEIDGLKVMECQLLAMSYGSDPDKKLKYLREVGEISERLYRESPSAESRAYLAQYQNLLGLLCQDPEETAEHLKRAIEIYKGAVNGGDSVLESLLASVYSNLGTIYHSEIGDYKKAEDSLFEALRLREKLAGESVGPEEYRELAEAYYALGLLRSGEENEEEAEEYYRKALDIQKKVAAETKVRRDHFVLARTYASLGNISKEKGELSEAKGRYTEALKILEDPAIEPVETDSERGTLADVYYSLSWIFRREENQSEAARYCFKTIEVYDSLAEVRKYGDILQLAICYGYAAVVCASSGDLGEAKRYLSEEIGACEILKAERITEALLRELAVCHSIFAEISEDPGEVEQHLILAIETQAELAGKFDSAENRRELARQYDRLCRLYGETGRPDGQLECCFRSRELWESVAKESGEAEDRYWLAYATGNIGLFTKDPEPVCSAYNIFVELCKTHPDNEEFARSKAELARILGFDN